MTRPWTFYAGLGALTLTSAALAGGAGSAAARITVLDDDAAAVARAIAPRPDGSPGLRLDDTLVQLPSSPTVLPSSRVAARVSAASLLGQGADRMAEILGEGVRNAGFHRVFVDDVGAAFAGQEGDDLAEALAILSKEHPSYAPTGVSLRVHLYVAAPGPLLSSPAWAGARAAVTRSAGVWLKAFVGSEPWNAAQWLAWPAEAGAQLVAAGSSRRRVHVLFTGGGQPAAWNLGRTGSACEVLGNGPGGYRLGASVDAFVSEYRRTLPITAVSKVPVVGCTGAPALTDAGAQALAGAAARELTGLAIPPGGLVTPPLPAGQPAQITLQLGADPLGLAAGLGVSPEAFWTAARARLEVRGPGIATDVTVEGDGAARMEFTPSSPGPVTMRLVIDRTAISRALGAETEIVGPLHGASVSPAFIRRVVADPSGWQLRIPLVQPGGAPGSPVLEIVPPTG